MIYAKFEATCPFEIGDKIKVNGVFREIIDIACIHYVKYGFVEFRYRLDGDRNYVMLESNSNDNK